mmetsp:Transcript_19588/g.60565  ORF Transcript_19588/g.60565 Transcript_19588/m.60565 type:complete len:513 (-) Transcript_19588:2021-3559(-)
MLVWMAKSMRRNLSLRAALSSATTSLFSSVSKNHLMDSCEISGRSAGTSCAKSVCRRAPLPRPSLRMSMRLLQRATKSSFIDTFLPSLMTNIISGVSTRLVRSRLTLMAFIFLKLPSTWPKSMWKSAPDSWSMMLPLCRSAMPRRYVATQQAAQLAENRSRDALKETGSPLCSSKYLSRVSFWKAPPREPEPQTDWISDVSFASRTTSIQPTSTSVAVTRYVRSQHSMPACSHSASICRIACNMAASWRRSSRVLKMATCVFACGGASSVGGGVVVVVSPASSSSSKTRSRGAALDERTRQESGRTRPQRLPGMHGRSMPAGSSPDRESRRSSRVAKALRACLSSKSAQVAVTQRNWLSSTTCFSSSVRTRVPTAPRYAASMAPCRTAVFPPLDISHRKPQKSDEPTNVGFRRARSSRNFISAVGRDQTAAVAGRSSTQASSSSSSNDTSPRSSSSSGVALTSAATTVASSLEKRRCPGKSSSSASSGARRRPSSSSLSASSALRLWTSWGM